MDGFTIKCNKCGTEVEIKKDTYNSDTPETENDAIKLSVGGMETAGIDCECGNSLYII